MISDLGIIFKVYLISLGLQFLVWPWVSKWFKGLADGGWALGRVLGLLSISLPVWFVGHVLPVNTDLGVTIVILLLVLIGLRITQGCDPRIRVGPLRIIFVEEGLFLLGLVGLSLVRGFQPDILGLEKFMDFGFIKQYLVSSKLPVNDMWLAGESINYYSFGHFLASILTRIWGVGLAVGYNLMLAWILGTSLALSFSIIVSLGGGMIGGIMGSLLACLGGNSHVLWYLIKNNGLENYWYADATRFIANTIHEYPGYSFVVSDLHAHVLGLPVVLAFILVLVNFWRWLQAPAKGGQAAESSEPYYTIAADRRRFGTTFRLAVILGVLMGVMAMTNTWDVAIYGLLLVVFGVCKGTTLPRPNGREGPRLKPLLLGSDPLKLGLIIVVAGVVAVPWFLNFVSFSDGVALVDSRSPIWQMGVLWGGHIVVTLLGLWLAIGKKVKKKNLLVVALGMTAILLLIIPEILYVKDIYSSHQRANTMFKLTYQSFIMMSLLFGWVVGRMMTRCRPQPKAGRPLKVRNPLTLRCRALKVTNCLSLSLMFVLWGGLMIFPIQSFDSYYGGFKNYKGISGLSWLKKDNDKWEIIKYLEENRDNKNLVEAVGDSYSLLNSVSAFSGVPTVVGWRVHEWLWRGGYDVVREREGKVRNFYENGDRQILEDYDVGWVVVGVDEKKEYKVNESEIQKLGQIVWRGGDSYLVKITADR